MNKATVVYVSASGKSCLVKVEKAHGKIATTETGFVAIASGQTVELNEELDLPDYETEIRELVDEATGEIKKFKWFTW